MDCQQLTLAQWTPQGSKPVIEMVATGNSRVKGGQFDAIAERISYTEANGQVTIEAPSRGNAELMAAERLHGTQFVARHADRMGRAKGVDAHLLELPNNRRAVERN